MKEKESLKEEMVHDRLTDTIPYLLAGFTGHTSGNKVNSVTVQQAGLSGYRVIIRAVGIDKSGDTVHLVSFTIGSSAAAALLLAEGAYRDDVIQWKIDRFAEGNGDHGLSKNGKTGLTITD